MKTFWVFTGWFLFLPSEFCQWSAVLLATIRMTVINREEEVEVSHKTSSSQWKRDQSGGLMKSELIFHLPLSTSTLHHRFQRLISARRDVNTEMSSPWKEFPKGLFSITKVPFKCDWKAKIHFKERLSDKLECLFSQNRFKINRKYHREKKIITISNHTERNWMYRCDGNSKVVVSSSESPPMLQLPEATRGKSHQVPSGSSSGPWCPSTGRRSRMDRAVSPLPADCFHLVFVSPEAAAVSEELGSDASTAPAVRIHGARHARKMCHCWLLPCAHQEEERAMRHIVTFILTQPEKSQLSLGFTNVNLH